MTWHRAKECHGSGAADWSASFHASPTRSNLYGAISLRGHLRAIVEARRSPADERYVERRASGTNIQRITLMPMSSGWLSFVGAALGGTGGVLIAGYLATSRRQRTHESRLRTAAAHDSARERLGPAASQVARWAEAVAYEAIGPDVGFYDPETQVDTSPSAALDALREIKSTHPTKEVRTTASSLFDAIANPYADVYTYQQGFAGFPTHDNRELINEWGDRANELIELIQTPIDEPSWRWWPW